MQPQPATVDRQIEASLVFGRRAFLPKQERPVDLLNVDAATARKETRQCAAMSALPLIVLQKSNWTTEDKFSGLWARPRMIVRGTTETRDELTGNFGSALEDASISDYRLILLSRKKR